ncbi:MAG: RHS repeat-associated core domain-containing protein, partial [Chloroflexi bacterium]|nr:RHS repeat-associated core domain-containing protein [Chloroflexota bacterium]
TQTGTLASRQTYYAFGTPRASDVAQITTITDYTFTGQRADSSDGLMFYNARYYDAAIGRFTQPDTIVPDWYDPQELNRYTYTRNNPLRYTDPSGHCAIICTGAIGLVVGGLVGFGAYAITHQGNFNTNDALVAAGTGAAAGLLIGSGVGIAAGSSVLGGMLTSAGIGAAGNELYYTATHQSNFNATDLVIQSGMGAATGAATGFAAAGPFSAGAKIVASGVYNAMGAEFSYIYDKGLENVTPAGIATTGTVGFMGGALGGKFAANDYSSVLTKSHPIMINHAMPTPAVNYVFENSAWPAAVDTTIGTGIRDWGVWTATNAAVDWVNQFIAQ